MEKELIAQFKHFILVMAFTMPRLVAIFSIIPIIGRVIQGQVRNSVIFALALILYPVVSQEMPQRFDSVLTTVAIVFKEVVVGVIIGFFIGLIFWAIEAIGFVIDNQRGSTMASVFDPMSGEQTSLFGSLLFQFMTVLFFTTGGFLTMLGGIYETYRLWPVFSFFPELGQDFAVFFLKQMDRFMYIMVVFAAPLLIAIFLAEFGLGLINRFAPQLNVFFLSMPIKSGIASFIMILYLSVLWGYLKEDILSFDQTILFLKKVVHQ